MACLERVQMDAHAPVFKQSPIDDLYALAAKAVSLLGEPGNSTGPRSPSAATGMS